MTVFLTQNLHFSLMNFGSIWVGVSMLKAIGIGAVLIRSRRLKCPSRSEDWCVVCHYCFKNSRTHIFLKHY
jgi:hypothetical protein